jgi:hypothetical protein
MKEKGWRDLLSCAEQDIQIDADDIAINTADISFLRLIR